MPDFINDNPIISSLVLLFTFNAIGKKISGKRNGPVTYILALIFSAIGTSCNILGEPIDTENQSPNFYRSVDGTKIIYSPMGNWFELGKTEMIADPESFVSLGVSDWAKDKDHIFFKSYPLDYLSIDTTSFKIKDYYFATDKDNVYKVADRYDKEGIIVVEGADPSSYEEINHSWAKDKDNLFFDNHLVDADMESFELLTDAFARDKNHLYAFCSPFLSLQERIFLPVSDEPDKIQVINERYLRDDKQLYYFSYTHNDEPDYQPRKIAFSDFDSVEFLGNHDFVRVNNTVYFNAYPLSGIDAKTFHKDKNGYWRDKDHLCNVKGVPFKDVDYKTLEFVKDRGGYYRDARYDYLAFEKRLREDVKK